MPSTLDFTKLIGPDALACVITNKYTVWKQARDEKEKQWKEIRDYVFATDTRTTSNKDLPWRNTTTRPKLCQIRDNLHANYMAALFPNDKWFRWVPGNQESALQEKSRSIESYMRTKLNEVRFREFIATLLYDYIDYGNCFCDVEYVKDYYSLEDGTKQKTYEGPRPIRISPVDILFDITAPSFEKSPKIVRRLVSLGDLKNAIESLTPENREPYEKALQRIKQNRAEVSAMQSDRADYQKSDAFVADGFGNILAYYNSGMVEFLTFEGNLYDEENDQLLKNYRVTVVDRAYVVEKDPIKNWFGKSSIVHAGWRLRPDNLMAMGPLDNLVGMQYRIDHLENLKSDIFDLIAFPPLKQKGYVEDWVWAPGERIFMDENADVESLAPPPTALQADQQIAYYEQQMEEMAGAPKEAMGIRTPGEKTAFEVERLATAASRMFESKIAYFEAMVVEPLLNYMLETARRNLDTKDLATIVDDDFGVREFLEITKEDLQARGKLVPIGARHFASKNRMVQNLTTLSNTPLYQDPKVSVHFSGWQMAKLLEDTLDLADFSIVRKNVAIPEQLEQQQLMQAAEEEATKTTLAPTESPDDADIMNELPEAS